MKKNNISVWTEDSDLTCAAVFQDESSDQRAAQLLEEIESVFALVTEEVSSFTAGDQQSSVPLLHSSITTDEIPAFLAEENEKKKKGTPGRKRRQPKTEEMADPFEMDSEDSMSDFGAGGKTRRRRQIDPTTCERDYSQDEVEFMNALDEYKRKNGRMFPTCSEILEVVRSLGYVKMPLPEESLEKDTANNVATTRLDGRTLPFKDEEAGQTEEIVTVFWNQETLKHQENLPDSGIPPYSDVDYYREPLLIF